MDDLEFMLSGDLSGERLVVFSCFKRVVEFAARRLAAYRPLVIHSGVSAKDRRTSGGGSTRTSGPAAHPGHGRHEPGPEPSGGRAVWSLDLPWNPGPCASGSPRGPDRPGRPVRAVGSLAAQTPAGGATVDDWFDGLIFPRKRAA